VQVNTKWAVLEIDNARTDKIQVIKAEGLSRMQEINSSLDSVAEVEIWVLMWPGLDEVSLGADAIRLKDIYVYVKSKIAWVTTASEEDMDNYDPATDIGWPSP
jgi:hypothetical protein